MVIASRFHLFRPVPSNVANGARFRRLLWPAGPLGAVALGVAVLALPARMEGPPLVAISPGHALSLVDGVGVIPLIVGSLWLHVGLWQRRSTLARWAQSRPATGIGLAFAAGLGLGLLLASAFSTFYWWWALGAAIFAAANGAAVVVAYLTEPQRESP
jgi:hypothetical protein